jgi:hypothetical protein
MISVPEAGYPPSVCRPTFFSNAVMIEGGIPCGKVVKGRSRIRPVISQCPVVVSFPGDASAIRPKWARGVLTSEEPFQIGKHEPAACLGTIQNTVSTLISIPERIRKCADANSVKNNHEYAPDVYSFSPLDAIVFLLKEKLSSLSHVDHTIKKRDRIAADPIPFAKMSLSSKSLLPLQRSTNSLRRPRRFDVSRAEHRVAHFDPNTRRKMKNRAEETDIITRIWRILSGE